MSLTAEQLRRIRKWYYALVAIDNGVLDIDDVMLMEDLDAMIVAAEASGQVRTRSWRSVGSQVAIQFRTDRPNKVWLHTDLGWVPLSNAPDDEQGAEDFAVKMAADCELDEDDETTARSFL